MRAEAAVAEAKTGTNRAATLGDVARRAGVSLSTASKALNGRGEVAPSTRERVEHAARELGFTTNLVARSLLEGKTGTVGLLTSDLEGRFVIPILMGAEDAFGAGQVNIFLCDARGDAIREQHHIRALLNRRVDGIIVVGHKTNPRASLGHRLPVPVVYAYAPSEDPTDHSITPDNRGGGRLAAEHVLSCGRTRIAHITGDPAYAAAVDRAQGVSDALASAGLKLVGEPMFSVWTEQWGRDATAALLDSHPEVDAIVCGSDQIARGVLDTLRDYGRRIPEDVAVIGFDDWRALTLNARPPLSTIDPGLQELGRMAARALFGAIEAGETSPGTSYAPGRLVIRGSTIATR